MLGLDDFLPEYPQPTGDAQSVYAGQVTSASELIPGPATSGMVGDYYIRNARARFVIQQPARVVGIVPEGGNLVDAVPVAADGSDAGEDHFGELAMVYLVGRTCRHDTVTVIQDGSGGGAAVIAARGHSASLASINLRGMGLLAIPFNLDPDIEDDVACQTTYVLYPDSPTLEVYWTLFNPNDTMIRGPFGAFSDTGGEIDVWGPTYKFERLGISALAEGTEPAPIPYAVYQGPGVSYGLMPVHDDLSTPNAVFLIQGIAIVLYGADTLLDIVNADTFHLTLPGNSGVTQRLNFSVGRDAADHEEQYQATIIGGDVAPVSGTVSWMVAGTAAPARIGLYEDVDTSGTIGADDLIISYFDADDTGAFEGQVPPGNYLIRAEVQDLARSSTAVITVPASGLSDVSLELPDPVLFDYTITDDETGEIIPGKLTVLGRHPVFPDQRVFSTFDRVGGVVRMVWSVRGTTVDVGDGADPQLALPAGGTYRVYATRGTEYSTAWVDLTPQAGDPVGDLQLRLRRVAPADGYVASEFHQHGIGSPDSTITREHRLATFLADGVELGASTDHDYVEDLQPLVDAWGVAERVRMISGVETTPFAYGHFNAFPIERVPDDPSYGAIDWSAGPQGFAMIPGEIFAAMRERGAEVVQINHPRSSSTASTFMAFFDRAALTFDYAARAVYGDPDEAPVPNDWLRLPGVSLFDDRFDTLEVWNGFGMGDTNADGVREFTRLDNVLRDWFNFLSFGMEITPIGNSDTHWAVKDPTGMPRTYVRVVDDSPANLASGMVVDELFDTLLGRGGAPRDVVVTNGPYIRVTVGGDDALGRVIDASADGSVRVDIEIVTPAWAPIDTVEIFANLALDPPDGNDTWLQPLACFTSRDPAELAIQDPCALAPAGGAQVLTVIAEEIGDGFTRYTAAVSVVIADTDIVNRPGASGSDAWLVVRARGDRGTFPALLEGAITDDNLDVLVTGDAQAIDAAMQGVGVPATAFTAPVFVDFDGGGYAAPFAP